MELKQYKPGSKVQHCRDAYASGGEKAFLAKATELGLAQGTIREWQRMFARQLQGEDTTRRKPARVALDQRPKPAAPASPGDSHVHGRIVRPSWAAGDVVFYCGDPTRWGRVVQPGPAKSTIKWRNGNVVDVPNNDLHKMTPEYQELNSVNAGSLKINADDRTTETRREDDESQEPNQPAGDGRRRNQAGGQRPDMGGAPAHKAVAKGVRTGSKARKR